MASPRTTRADVEYAELHCLSNFSFLRGASHPQELVTTAAELGYAGLALTDECSVAGVVRAHVGPDEEHRCSGRSDNVRQNRAYAEKGRVHERRACKLSSNVNAAGNAYYDKLVALHAQVVMVIAGRARHWVRH